jgi:hypothetical protein
MKWNAVRKITRWQARPAVAAVLATFALLLGACDPAINSVRIETGSAPLRPVFVLADSTGRGRSGPIYGLSVVPCGSDSAAWQISATQRVGAPQRLVYGETPEGFVTLIGPAPLHRGCYDVFVTNGRRARFRVDGQGRVVPEAQPKADTTSRAPT